MRDQCIVVSILNESHIGIDTNWAPHFTVFVVCVAMYFIVAD